jgi:uncharacterized protein YdeI (YjbR/CyaY-like superfamily)
VWLKIAKKGEDGISYAAALDVALCYGWIDGQKGKLDQKWWLQRFTPRRPNSRWSKINCLKVTELIRAGKVAPAGLREVESAKADGRWDAAYASQRAATVPADLQRALNDNERARSFFDNLDRANRYAILYRVESGRRPETRAENIEKYVEMLSRGEMIHPVRRRSK